MACRIFRAQPLSEPMMVYWQLNLWGQFQWMFNHNSTIYIQHNEFGNAVGTTMANLSWPQYLYYNYEKYPLSPLKPRSLAFIEQYLPNISDPVYSVHQSFMWFLWLNWRKSTFYPVTAPNDSKCWPIVTSSIQAPTASHCDVTMTDCFRLVSMDAFLAQWCWGQWFNGFVKTRLCQVFGLVVPCLWWTMHVPLMHGFGTELIKNLPIWLAKSRDYHLFIYKVYQYNLLMFVPIFGKENSSRHIGRPSKHFLL